MDYWRKKYLIPAMAQKKQIGLIGIGDIDAYVQNGRLEERCDPFRLHASGCTYDVYDISDPLVQKVRAFGIRAHTLDVTEKALPQKYDLIFAGDVIEHTDSPVRFLRNVAASLNADGIMVITAPNAVYWRQFLRTVEYAEHKQAFNAVIFRNLARLVGLEILELTTFQTTSAGQTASRKISHAIGVALAPWNRANSLLLVAKTNRQVQQPGRKQGELHGSDFSHPSP